MQHNSQIITKNVANRIHPFLNNIISPLQSSFVLGRAIHENIIIIKEVAHVFNKAKKGRNLMAIKIDLTKTFDS